MNKLILPHGGTLVDLFLDPEQAETEKHRATEYLSWDLTPPQLCDVELLLDGSFSPLRGFMQQVDYRRVVEQMRLADGTLWPIPITLAVTEAFAAQLAVGAPLALRDPEGLLVAVMEVADIWTADKQFEAQHVYGTTDAAHPGVQQLLHQSGPVYVGGPVKGVERPVHYDFRPHRRMPREVRERFERLGWTRVIGYHTQSAMHRADVEQSFRAAQRAEANLFLHPATGVAHTHDVEYFARIRCYEHVARKYPEQTTLFAIVPLAPRWAGPREALWHAIVRQNYGCTHFVVGDHHGDVDEQAVEGFGRGRESARELYRRHQDELGIEMVPAESLVYVRERAEYVAQDEVQADETVVSISAAEFARRLNADLQIEEWHSYPEVIAELQKAHPPRRRQGFTVFFTGFSGSGKSTIANALLVKLMEMGGRRVTLLDGDVVRKHLSSELGFSREHRDLNIRRIGYVASEITKNGGVAICAPIAPYAITRAQVREMIEAVGGFIEVHVATPIDVCEMRDRKGLYAKARAGLLKGLTGVDDPYEVPLNPELSINTAECSPEEAAQRIILKLEKMGFIAHQ